MATYFVDFSAANNGDGSSHVQAPTPGGVGAFNSLVGLSFSIADVYWVRRQISSEPYSIININSAGVKLIGWPLVGDTYFHERPTDVRSAWDGDLETHAKIFQRLDFVNNVEVHRFNIVATGLRYNFISTGLYNLIDNCIISAEREDVLASSSMPNIKNTVFNLGAITRIFASITIVDLLIENVIFNIEYLYGNSTVFLFNGNRTKLIGMTINIKFKEPTANSIINFGGSIPYINGLVINCDNTGGPASSTYFTLVSSGSGTFYNLSFNDMGVAFGPTTTTSFMHLKNYEYNYQGVPATILTYSTTTIFFRWLIIDRFKILNAQDVSNSMSNTTFLKIGCINANGSNIVNPSSTIPPVFIELQNINNVPNSFKNGNSLGWYESSGVNRTGGSNYSVKATRTNLSVLSRITNGFSGSNYIMQFPHPIRNLYIDLMSGENDVTVYLALKNYGSNIDTNSLWMEILYKDVNGVQQCESTRNIGSLISDGSTWNGDTGLTPIRLEASVNSPFDQKARIKIIGVPYKPGAYYYIDPIFVVS